VAVALTLLVGSAARGQLTDMTQAPNAANTGIAKSLTEQIGAGQGDIMTPDSSWYLIRRDPFRAIRRGRQLFQRKFTAEQGVGPRAGDGAGPIESAVAIGAGLADSCAACHGRPRGSAGFGGDVATRPDSRDAPHLFGLGLQEMLADEITRELRGQRDQALELARRRGGQITVTLRSKGIDFGTLTAFPDGTVDTSGVDGVDADLRVRPFFAQGGKFSIREFVVGAFNDEMGLQAADPVLLAAANGADVVTATGMMLSGSVDAIAAPPVSSASADADGDGVAGEIDPALVDYVEFYLFNYFKPGRLAKTTPTRRGRELMRKIGCTECHVPSLWIEQDRRVADVETSYHADEPGFNHLFAVATPLYDAVDDASGHPALTEPKGERFLVRNIFTDFKRHDLGPAFHERNFDGTMTTAFMTEPLWGAGSTPPYGHDGRSINLTEVILRHGGEAQASRDAFAALADAEQEQILAFLNSLVLFPPDDTASNLNPGDPTQPGFPQFGHGSIALQVLFNDPTESE